MANLITWLDDYLIGVDEVDQQHQYLFTLINETLQCNEKEKLQLALMKLYKYTREHFSAEEAVMRKVGYTNYKQHQEQHNSLVTKLNEKSKAALEDPSKRRELDCFLVSWLVLHILGEDIPIGNFIRENAEKKHDI